MLKHPPLAITLAALSLMATAAACGGNDKGDDTVLNDSGSAPQDSGGHDAAVSDASTSHDAASSDASSSSDASADAGSSSDAGVDAGKVLTSVAGGAVSALDGGTSTAKGEALLVRTAAGHSWVSLQVSGLDAGTKYPAHVHVLPCAMAAGGHYMFDPDAGADGGQANEVWPTLMTDSTGQARAFVDVDKVLRDDAKAIVVHNPVDASKMLCADLVVKAPYATSGSPVKLASGADAGIDTIGGTGTLTRNDDGKTTAVVNVQGLKASTAYMAHVHDQPCAFASGGGHYKIDYGNDAAVQSNEIWLVPLMSDAAGAAQQTVTVDHSARAEAQAIVIHAMDGTRLACIDLKP